MGYTLQESAEWMWKLRTLLVSVGNKFGYFLRVKEDPTLAYKPGWKTIVDKIPGPTGTIETGTISIARQVLDDLRDAVRVVAKETGDTFKPPVVDGSQDLATFVTYLALQVGIAKLKLASKPVTEAAKAKVTNTPPPAPSVVATAAAQTTTSKAKAPKPGSVPEPGEGFPWGVLAIGAPLAARMLGLI